MYYDTVIFDLDGTLLDTLDDLSDSVNYALEDAGYPPRSRDEVRRFVGNGVLKLMERSVPAGTPQADMMRCLETFRAHYAKNKSNKTGPYAGIMDLLKALKEKDIKMAVVSNKFDAAVKELCEPFFGEYIRVAIGEKPDVAKKPEPDSLYAALDALGVGAEGACYVGDSEVDIQTANNAKMDLIAVSWGFRDREELQDQGADKIIDTPLQLMQYIQ